MPSISTNYVVSFVRRKNTGDVKCSVTDRQTHRTTTVPSLRMRAEGMGPQDRRTQLQDAIAIIFVAQTSNHNNIM